MMFVPPSPEALAAHRVARYAWADKLAREDKVTTISNEFAAEIVAKMRAHLDSRDELTETTDYNRDGDLQIALILKLYDDLQALTKATAFLGAGIKPPSRVDG